MLYLYFAVVTTQPTNPRWADPRWWTSNLPISGYMTWRWKIWRRMGRRLPPSHLYLGTMASLSPWKNYQVRGARIYWCLSASLQYLEYSAAVNKLETYSSYSELKKHPIPHPYRQAMWCLVQVVHICDIVGWLNANALELHLFCIKPLLYVVFSRWWSIQRQWGWRTITAPFTHKTHHDPCGSAATTQRT